MWYGFLFALGFFVGYFVLVYILERYFLRYPKFEEKDVSDFRSLLYCLKHPSDKKIEKYKEIILSKLDKKRMDFFLQNKIPSLIPSDIKKDLTEGLNRVLQEERFSIEEPSSEEPGSSELSRIVINRLCLEDAFPGIFVTIKLQAKAFAEKLTLFVMIGAIAGARIGDVLFYQNRNFYFSHPLAVFKVWEGGLASHGGILEFCLLYCCFIGK